MRKFVVTVCFAIPTTAPCLTAAQSDRSPNKRTIEIHATAKAEVPAKVAIVKIGYTNQAVSKQTAYAENTREGEKDRPSFIG